MIINFEEMTFKNILSFGAIPTTIKFSEGLNITIGKNGTGKSTIIDSLSFCLFGKPYRKIKLEQLINRKNKKNMVVSVKFNIDNKESYTITRSMAPNKISIVKNDDETDILSTKKLTQDEIDKILGINYQLFKQVISLAINYNKPFISLESSEKRSIIEQIFNITVFGEMLKIVKKENAVLKTKIEVDGRSEKLLKENLIFLNTQIKESNEAIKNFEKNKKQELLSNEQKKNSFEQEKLKYQSDIETLNSSSKEFIFNQDDYNEINNKITNVNKLINNSEFSINNIDKTVSFLKDPKNSICPTCKSKIDEKHATDEINSLTSQKDKLTIELETHESSLKDYKSRKLELEQTKEKINLIKEKLNVINNKIKICDMEIEHCDQEEINIKKRPFDFNMDSISNEFKNKKIEYKKVLDEINDNTKKLKLNVKVCELLSESGIKSYFFKKLIPILNAQINQYLKLFELPVILKFDELMDEKIYNTDNINETVNYFSYSEGEKKRIDLAILFSFINITKMLSNWNCNLLIIDELLDGAIDDQGMEKLLTGLNNMISDSIGLCVYIISHKLHQDYNSYFKKCMTLQKKY